MKKKMKRISAMALTGAMCFGLFGCGDKESSDSEYKTLAQELGYGYLSKYDTIDDMNLDYVNSVSTAQGKLYLCGDYYDEASGTNSTKLYERDLASGTVKEIALPELVNNETTSEYIQQLSVCSDGSGYWIITNQYTFVSQMMPEAVPAEEPEETVEETQEEATPAEEAPAEGTPEEGTEAGDEPVAEAEGVSGQYQMQLLTNEVPAEEAPADDTAEVTALEGETDEETATEDAAVEDVAEDGAGGGVAISEDGSVESIDEGAYQEPEQKYFAKKCDMSGALLQTIDLTEISEEMEYFYCQAAVQDASGNLYLASDQNILCFGSDGSRKENIMNDSIYIQSMITTGDGTVLASGFNSEDGAMQVCRVENGSLTVMELTDMEKYANCYLYPGVGNTALMSDGTMLYSLDAATGQTTKLLSWLDSDINSNNISSVVSNSDDTILVLLQNYSYNSAEVHYELGTLTKTPVDQIPERTILTLGAEYLDDTLRNAVIDFNRKSDTYRVTMVDYSVYNTEENYSAGAEQLDRDVISGNCPDILSLSSGNAERYISKGALTDMTSLMEKDGEITMDSLLSGPMQAYMQDGKLYGMPYSFGLNTLYASAKLVGDRESWTIADMSQIIDGLDEDTKIVNWYIQTDFLTNLVYQNMDQFVDYSKATCSFDSDTFKSLMEVSAKLPESYEDNEFVVVDGSGDEMQQLQTGDTLMAMGCI